jgi:cytochrome c oxidase subunit II
MPSLLDTHGPKAAETANLWWLMFWISAAVFVLVLALLAIALARQIRPPATDARGLVRLSRLDGLTANGLVIAIGLVLPAAVMVLLLIADLRSLAVLASPATPARVTVQIKAHQFWWEVRYAEAQVTTANEIHVPVGEPVQLQITAEDVIHSVWIPQLMGKLDAIPFQTNTTWLQADQPGDYLGECAEFCGLQHAHMRFLVLAETQEHFDAWIGAQQQPAASPTDPGGAAGAQAFSRAGCISCHTIRYGDQGIGGTVGPDLTHVGGRRSLAAGTLENSLAAMEGWISNPQAIKPGNIMPAVALDADSLRALAAYLESLK